MRNIMLHKTCRTNFSETSYWDKQATIFNENASYMQDLTHKQLERIILKPEHSVLEVGAGTGRITLPLAKKVKNVTAVEPSLNMLNILKANSKKENTKNITYVQKAIEDLEPTKVKSHDIVLASFSLVMADVEEVLMKMNTIASKSVYVFLSASQWLDEEIKNIIYEKNYSNFILPDYEYVYYILRDLGITANVDVWGFQYQQRYDNLEDITMKFTKRYNIPVNKQSEVKNFLSKNVVHDNKKEIWFIRNKKAATIWWTKSK